MGIRFFCDACDRKLNVKSFLAGKRGICPHCGARVDIPEDSTRAPGEDARSTTDAEPEAPAVAGGVRAAVQSRQSSGSGTAVATVEPRAASATVSPAAPSVSDPIDEAPDAVWYVRPPSGGQFGPADGTIMRKWIAEGRVSSDSLVWREGWDDWKKAEPLFPELSHPAPPDVSPAPTLPTRVVSNGSVATASKPSVAAPKPTTIVKRKRKSNGMGIAIIAVLGLLIAALATVLLVIVLKK